MPAPLTKIVQLAAGSNHVLALDQSGKVITWGAGQHDQLGRKTIVKRTTAHNLYTGEEGLTPAGISSLPGKKRGEGKAIPVKVACGAYHSFILDNQGRVYSWGLNNYGELGIREDAGADNASNPQVRLVETLADYKVVDIDGGEHHSLCCTVDGKLLTWGRIDGFQVGISGDELNESNAIFDEHGKPRILARPTVVAGEFRF
jgi:regulator of chromosome condensation